MKFDRLGVFTYSPEEGTPAAGFAGQIDEAVKEDPKGCADGDSAGNCL